LERRIERAVADPGSTWNIGEAQEARRSMAGQRTPGWRTRLSNRPVRRGHLEQRLAVDLGTARTQLFVPGVGVVIDEPTVVGYGAGGVPVAAGQDAWSTYPFPTQLRLPIRAGVVRDPVGCVHVLTMLLEKARLRSGAVRDVAVCLPATASEQDALVVAAVVNSAIGGRVVPVESTLAAAMGAGLDVASSAPRVVCDVGAGVTEVAVVGEGRVMAAAGVRVGLVKYHDDQTRHCRRLVELVRQVLDDLPALVAADAVAAPALMVGGGALRPDLVRRFGEASGLLVRVPTRPREATARGLGGCAAATPVPA
jgi:actin-like ATPase involved in cell morphogenesis